MVQISRADFEEAVNDALDSLPDEVAAEIARANVVILVEEEPERREAGQELLGLYVGIPLDQRSVFQGFAEPDRIVIYRGPLQRVCRTVAQVSIYQKTRLQAGLHAFNQL